MDRWHEDERWAQGQELERIAAWEQQRDDEEQLADLRRDVTVLLAVEYGAHDTLDDTESDAIYERAEREVASMDTEELMEIAA